MKWEAAVIMPDHMHALIRMQGGYQRLGDTGVPVVSNEDVFRMPFASICAYARRPFSPGSGSQVGKPMVLRTARKGARAGSQFWGCPAYPGCKGVREAD